MTTAARSVADLALATAGSFQRFNSPLDESTVADASAFQPITQPRELSLYSARNDLPRYAPPTHGLPFGD